MLERCEIRFGRPDQAEVRHIDGRVKACAWVHYAELVSVRAYPPVHGHFEHGVDLAFKLGVCRILELRGNEEMDVAASCRFDNGRGALIGFWGALFLLLQARMSWGAASHRAIS